MKIPGKLQPLKRNDLFSDHVRDGQLARPNGPFIEQHGARAALPQPAAESGIVERQVVTENVKQRALRIHIHNMHLAIHFQRCMAHSYLSAPDCNTSGLHAGSQLHDGVDRAPSEVQVEGSRVMRALFVHSRGGRRTTDPLPYELARTSHENLLVDVGPFHCTQTQRESSAVKWHRLHRLRKKS